MKFLTKARCLLSKRSRSVVFRVQRYMSYLHICDIYIIYRQRRACLFIQIDMLTFSNFVYLPSLLSLWLSLFHLRQSCCQCEQVTVRHVTNHVVAVRRRRSRMLSMTSQTAFPLPRKRYLRGVGEYRANHVTTTMTSRRRLPVVTRWTGHRNCVARLTRCSSRPTQLTSDTIMQLLKYI